MAMTKEQAWDYAIGMLKVDGLEPSEDMLEMIEKEKRGNSQQRRSGRFWSGSTKRIKRGNRYR